MAERRMFTKKVTDDDNFMALSSSAQALYLHLSMSADDDGFCNQVSISMFKAHASVQDLQALLEKRYVYQFENGVIVIKHWRMANALRKDRYTPTIFQEELSMLELKDNDTYVLATERQPNGNHCLPQVRLGKDSIGYNTSDKSEAPEKKSKKKPIYDHTSIPYRAAKWLSEQIMERLPEQKAYTESDLQRWADDFRLMNTADGYEWELIEKVLQYSQEDYFWSQNILSASKFRKQFSTLLAKAKASGYV